MDYVSYFLFCLMKYPQSVVESKPSSQQLFTPVGQGNGGTSAVECLHRLGIHKWIEGNAYLTLVHHYVHHYFHSSHSNGHNHTASSSSGSSSSGGGRSHTDTSESVDQEAEQVALRRRELFVRLAIEFWIDLGNVVRVNHHKVGSYREQLSSINAQGSSSNVLNNASLVANTLYQPSKGKMLLNYV